MTDSCGSRSNSARATVSPPIPESNTPSGALFMDGDGNADAARKRADFEIGREVLQVGGDVGLRPREEMIEDPEHEPVLHFLPLAAQVRGVNSLEVVRFLLRFEGHHDGHTLPRYEGGAGRRPARDRLAPARKNEGAEKGAHRPHAVMHGVGWQDHVSRIDLSRILTYKSARRHDCKNDRQCDPHRATNTFKRPRSNSTVHSRT